MSDSVDVCHGFSVGGSERVTVGTRVWLIRFFGSPPTHPSLRLRPSYHIYPTSFLHRLLRRYVIDLVSSSHNAPTTKSKLKRPNNRFYCTNSFAPMRPRASVLATDAVKTSGFLLIVFSLETPLSFLVLEPSSCSTSILVCVTFWCSNPRHISDDMTSRSWASGNGLAEAEYVRDCYRWSGSVGSQYSTYQAS